MKRLHVHIKTDDLDASTKFYTAMFGQAPTQKEADYAKWLLDDPRAHVSLSSHGGAPGIDHAGISVETQAELDTVAKRLTDTGALAAPEENTTCCYARSNKYWARDPNGAVWELFQTFGASYEYGAEPDRSEAETAPANQSCCAPSA
ncbi:MAG: VOC family protein [Pseudomonadota bacterium]